MSSSAKTFIGALIVLNLGLVGLLLFRDRSIAPANASDHLVSEEVAPAALAAGVERDGGTTFVEAPSVAPTAVAQVAEPPAPVAPTAAVPRTTTTVRADPPRPSTQAPAPRREPEAKVASLPTVDPVLPADTRATRTSERMPETRPEPPRPITVTVPAGQSLPIALAVGLHSREVRTGDAFEATLRSALVVGGRELAPTGSDVTGRIVEVIPAGKTKGVEQLSLTLGEITIAGKTYSVTTSRLSFQGEDTKDQEAAMIGGGAVVGAIIGGIAGGKKGAAAGAVTGAAAGTGAALNTRGKPVTLASGAHLDFVLSESLRITLPGASDEPRLPDASEASPGVARR